MKTAMDFVSKLLRRGMDEDFNNLHLCYSFGHVQTNDGIVTLSHPSHLVSSKSQECLSIKGLSGVNAINICDGQSIDINITERNYIIKAPVINFRALLPYKSEYTPRILTKKQVKKATPVPQEFIKFIRSMTSFTIKDSDHQFASSINIIKKRMYATNNISVVRSTKAMRVAMEDCIIPRPLINAMLKVKADPIGVVMAETFIAFTYSNGAFAMCPKSTESAPDLGAVFDKFKKPVPISPTDKSSLERSLLMSTDGIITCKKGVLTTDNSEVKNTELGTFKCDVDNLTMLLKIFNNAKFTEQFTFLSNENFESILAGRA